MCSAGSGAEPGIGQSWIVGLWPRPGARRRFTQVVGNLGCRAAKMPHMGGQSCGPWGGNTQVAPDQDGATAEILEVPKNKGFRTAGTAPDGCVRSTRGVAPD
jgi:hypothetical protein